MPSISDTDLQRRARPCGCSAHHPVCTPRPDRRRSSRVTNLMYLSRANGRPHGHAVFNVTGTEVRLLSHSRRAGTARLCGSGRGTASRKLLISLHLQWTLTHPRLHQPVRALWSHSSLLLSLTRSIASCAHRAISHRPTAVSPYCMDGHYVPRLRAASPRRLRAGCRVRAAFAMSPVTCCEHSVVCVVLV